MARKKQEAEPLLAHKHAFVESLDNMMQRSMVLHQCIKTLLDGDKHFPGKDILRESFDAWHKSIFTVE